MFVENSIIIRGMYDFIVFIFIIAGATVVALDRDKMTALSWACLRGHLVCVQVLLDGGCEINHADKYGRTPLDLAAEKGHFRVVQVRKKINSYPFINHLVSVMHLLHQLHDSLISKFVFFSFDPFKLLTF